MHNSYGAVTLPTLSSAIKGDMDKKRVLSSWNSVKWLFMIILIMWGIATTQGMGSAEGSEILDYSSNAIGFCHAVAEVNYMPDFSNSRKMVRAQKFIVMCKTKGTALNYEETRPIRVIEGPQHRYILAYSTLNEAQEAVKWLIEQSEIQYAELDSTVNACATNDSEIISFRSVGATQLNLGGYLLLAQNYGSGSQTVAVIDSGVSTHSILRDRMRSYGFDYVDADNDPTNDLTGHGTHVAGIVADCTDGTPVWIYPIRVLNKVGTGQMSNVVAAVLEATDAGVDVINLSLESSEKSEALDDAIEEAVVNGTTVVISAGNSACDTSEVYPAHLTGEGIIVVGSVEASGEGYRRADYSNYGDSVDLYAFGSNIESCSRSGGYVVQSGTSMAAAHVSGICALMGLTHPGISPQAAERRLKSVCRDYSFPVLDVTGFVPASRGFALWSIVMDKGDILNVPTKAMPLTCHADISWKSADESILAIESDGCLRAVGEGTTELVASCLGFDDVLIAVTVMDEERSTMSLPIAMSTIEDEAFMGTGGKHIVLPDGVEEIGNSAFADCSDLQTITIPASVVSVGDGLLVDSEQAIILCSSGSMIQSYADEYKLQYITCRD